jgi:branched-chain amino acid transport system permease protein
VTWPGTLAVRGVVPAAALVAAIAFPLIATAPDVLTIAIWTLLYVIGAVAWNLFSGFTGYFSFGNAAFFGIGAYAFALLAEWWQLSGGYSAFFLLPLGGLIAAAIAVPLGLVAFRVRPMVFAVVTMAFFFIAQFVASNWGSLTHGSQGIQAPLPSWDVETFHRPFYYAALIVAVSAILSAWVIRRSHYGLTLLAIRDDEDRARGVGVRTGRRKLVALCIAAFFTGMAGGIYGFFIGFIYPQFAFNATYDITVVGCVLLGGVATLYGPVLGATIIVPLQQYFQLEFGVSGWSTFIYGAALLAILMYLPEGIVPTVARRLSELRRRRRSATCQQTGEQEGIPAGFAETRS